MFCSDPWRRFKLTYMQASQHCYVLSVLNAGSRCEGSSTEIGEMGIGRLVKITNRMAEYNKSVAQVKHLED